jgi:hypothetical protein
MTKLKFIDEVEYARTPPEQGDMELLLLEIAHQLRRIADVMERPKK